MVASGKKTNEAKLIAQEISLVEQIWAVNVRENLVYSLFPTTKSLTFFLISVDMDLAVWASEEYIQF